MQYWLLVGIIVVAATLFVSEKIAIDVASLSLAAVLIVTGLVSVKDGFSGFSSEATVTVAAFFVLARSLARTGAPALAAQKLVTLTKGRPKHFLGAMMVLSAVSASFLHVTGVVAVYLPIVMDAARKLNVSPSKFLIPLSYSGQFGGVCTLLGTTSNLVVSAIMVERGMPAIGMFEITKLGLSLFAVGFVYLMLVGWRLLPDRKLESDLPHAYGLERYLAELVVSPHSVLKGKTLAESNLRNAHKIHVIEIVRGHDRLSSPMPHEVLLTGDLLRVKATLDDMMEAATRLGLELPPEVHVNPKKLMSSPTNVVEAMVTAGSTAVRRTVRELEFRERYGMSVLAVKRRGKITLTDLRDIRLRRNDTLLLQGTRQDLRRLQKNPNFIVLSRVATPVVRRRHLYYTLGALAFVVGCTTTHVIPIAISTLLAALSLVIVGVVTNRQAYEAVEWRVVMMVAGVMPLGIAVANWHVAESLASGIIALVGKNPWLLLSACYLATMIVTEFVTHVACAVLMTPIVISLAQHAGLDPRPFCIAVIFATDTSFSTPVGYQANAMIFSSGGYKFMDFVRVGIPLNLLFWIASSYLIPWMWPLTK